MGIKGEQNYRFSRGWATLGAAMAAIFHDFSAKKPRLLCQEATIIRPSRHYFIGVVIYFIDDTIYFIVHVIYFIVAAKMPFFLFGRAEKAASVRQADRHRAT